MGISFFILAFIADLSASGSNWKDVDLARVVLTFVLIIGCGLLLSTFLFYRKKYKDRILFTIPIAAIFFSLCIFSYTIINEFGLFDEYNYFSAKRDIRYGKFQILSVGFILPETNEEVKEKIRNQFGYKTVLLGCIMQNGVDKYNAVMIDYLDKRNGKNWRIKQQHMFDSLRNLTK